MVNWVELLEAAGIDYATRGPNTKRGEVSVKCPYCGPDDPSEHMGISLTSENWGCLRNQTHRGHKPERLVAALLACSQAQAKLIVAQYSSVDPDNFGFDQPIPENPEVSPEQLPELREISRNGLSAKFWNYLKGRGFDPQPVIDEYSLTCCMTGRFKDRLIIPFYQNHELVAWSGRAIINPRNAPRYLSSNLIKTTLFNEDGLRGVCSKILFVVEGPFDAIKLDYYGRQYGARATCLSGTSMTPHQIQILHQISRQFGRVVLLLDSDAIEQGYAAVDWLHNAKLGLLPEGVKDPGALNEAQIKLLCRGE